MPSLSLGSDMQRREFVMLLGGGLRRGRLRRVLNKQASCPRLAF